MPLRELDRSNTLPSRDLERRQVSPPRELDRRRALVSERPRETDTESFEIRDSKLATRFRNASVSLSCATFARSVLLVCTWIMSAISANLRSGKSDLTVTMAITMASINVGSRLDHSTPRMSLGRLVPARCCICRRNSDGVLSPISLSSRSCFHR